MTPRILLLEDDPVTRAFMVAASEALPALVETAVDIASARSQVRTHDYDLWLVDGTLPDGRGEDWLAEMRSEGRTTPAIAHTAADDGATIAGLQDAGFVAVLVKPLTAAALQAAIGEALGGARAAFVDGTATASDAIWNETMALAALGGQRQHVDALRELFLGELPGACHAVRTAAENGQHDVLHATLHKLRASCGFVGAARIDTAVRALQAAPQSKHALKRFLAAAQDTLAQGGLA